MRLLKLLLPGLLAVCLVAAAQAPAPPAASGATDSKPATLSGVVVNGITKEPVRRAEVSLMPVSASPGAGMFGAEGPPGTRRATSDNEGKFTFVNVDPGRYRLSAQKSGFVGGVSGFRRALGMGAGLRGGAGVQVELAAGETLSNARIELIPQAVITGRVVDEEGEPLQNVMVQALRRSYLQGRRQFLPAAAAQTNDKGEFRITNLSPGKVILQVMAGRWFGAPTGITDQEPRLAYVTTYYPNVTEMNDAAPIEVTAGMELSGYDIRLQKARVVSVRGKVLDPSGQPANQVVVALLAPGAAGLATVTPSFAPVTNGAFELRNVQPGSYVLTVQQRQGGGPMRGGHREPIVIGRDDVEDLVIRMAAPVTVEGQIVMREARAADLSSVRVQLVEEGSFLFGAMSRQETSAEGRFTLEGVTPGVYRIRVMTGSVPGAWVASIRYGDQDATTQPVSITSGGVPLRVVLDVGAATVSGAVVDSGGPVAGATVVLLPTVEARRDVTWIRTGTTDQAGRFTINFVPPGDYLAFAFEDVEAGAWLDPELVKKVESNAVKLQVAKNASPSIVLTVTPAPQ